MRLLSSQGLQRGVFLGFALWGLAGCSSPTLQTKSPEVSQEVVCPKGQVCDGEGETKVTLIYHLASCEAGERGEISFSLKQRELAKLRPGESKAIMLPKGDHRIVLKGRDFEEVREVMLMGKGPAWVEIGCPTALFADQGLKPLVIRGSDDLSCPPTPVGAGGLRFEVSPGEVRTLFVPIGMHEVTIGSGSVLVEAMREGAVVNLPR